MKSQKSSILCYIFSHFVSIYIEYCHFYVYVLEYKHKVLCGISDIFSWQTIWDLSKKFCRWESKLSFSKYTKSENRQIWAIFPTFRPFHVNILNFLRFSCYCISTVSEIFKNQKSSDFELYMSHFGQFHVNILHFHDFRVMVKARDLR